MSRLLEIMIATLAQGNMATAIQDVASDAITTHVTRHFISMANQLGVTHDQIQAGMVKDATAAIMAMIVAKQWKFKEGVESEAEEKIKASTTKMVEAMFADMLKVAKGDGEKPEPDDCNCGDCVSRRGHRV